MKVPPLCRTNLPAVEIRHIVIIDKPEMKFERLSGRSSRQVKGILHPHQAVEIRQNRILPHPRNLDFIPSFTRLHFASVKIHIEFLHTAFPFGQPVLIFGCKPFHCVTGTFKRGKVILKTVNPLEIVIPRPCLGHRSAPARINNPHRHA